MIPGERNNPCERFLYEHKEVSKWDVYVIQALLKMGYDLRSNMSKAISFTRYLELSQMKIFRSPCIRLRGAALNPIRAFTRVQKRQGVN